MSKLKDQEFECEECGLVVLVSNPCECEACDIICCRQPMKVVKNKASKATEKKE